jgi:hypothetical protein
LHHVATGLTGACEEYREEPRLRVLENRALRKIFGPKRGEVTSEWKSLHNVELYELYSLPNIIRVMK